MVWAEVWADRVGVSSPLLGVDGEGVGLDNITWVLKEVVIIVGRILLACKWAFRRYRKDKTDFTFLSRHRKGEATNE
jgi:hypothetical protein